MIDFTKVFSAFVKHCSIRVLLSLVAQYDLQLKQLDTKTNFLNDDLEEEYLHDSTTGLEDSGKVCLFKRKS